jgi:hypothetical protein
MSRLFFLLALIVFLGAARAKDDEILPATECEGAPPNYLPFIAPPLGKWMGIFCSPGGHALVPKPGHLWVNKNAGAWMFFSHSFVKPTAPLADKHASYFLLSGYMHGRLGGALLDFAYKSLEANAGVTEKFSQAWYFTLRSNRNLQYTFFVFMNDSGPEWIVACIDQCKVINVVQAGPMEKFSAKEIK